MSNDYGRRAAARVRRTAGAVRRRVADESGLLDRVARLERRLRRTERELTELRKVVTGLDVAPGLPVPAKIGPVTAELAPELETVVSGVLEEHLSYVGKTALRTLATVVAELDIRHVPGVLVETGTALGGSAIVIAAAKDQRRPLKVYDVFGMIPPPGARDGDDVHERYETIQSGDSPGLGGETYYGYRTDLMDEVVEAFARHGLPVADNNVELIRGLFEDTLQLDEPVALAHLDGDWYESTMTCLTRITPLLSPGGHLVIDDYDAWSGCRTAVDEYFAGRTGFRFERRGKLHIVRG